MAWTISLCAYKTPRMTDFGHAFVRVSQHGTSRAAAGLSPANLPAGVVDELMTVVRQSGAVLCEFDSLSNVDLRQKTWTISEASAIAVMNRINADRRSNGDKLPDVDSLPADKIVKMENEARADGREWAGGPSYQLFNSNCANYALELCACAGVDVREYRGFLVTSPATFYSKLGA